MDPVLWLDASEQTYEEFLSWYDPKTTPYWRVGDSTALSGAVANPSVENRIAIANRLLDDGAVATIVLKSNQTNLLHHLFEQREHDWVREARLVQRLIDGGADINQRSPKFGPPLKTLYEEARGDAALGPLYDIIFALPNLDFDIFVSKTSGNAPYSLRELIERGVRKREMARRISEYLAKRKGLGL